MNTEKIYEDYRQKVFSYILSKVQNSDLAEDLCQNVFLKIYEKADTFDETKASVSTWIYTIARNTLTDYYRTRRVTSEIPETIQSEQSTEDEVINGEMMERLADALSQMDERMRDVIILRFYDGKTLREIADNMGISYAYVKVIQNKAFAFLRNFLENE
ncbi:MAG: sigma-70 family RNA polymerase sigma factor [Bacteroidales bacterium]|nr:sigma-70 family RNA polymerase sigma factor [Bacteroidales bacterium]